MADDYRDTLRKARLQGIEARAKELKDMKRQGLEKATFTDGQVKEFLKKRRS